MSWKTICWEAILLGFLFSCTGSDKDPMDRKYQIDYDYLKTIFSNRIEPMVSIAGGGG